MYLVGFTIERSRIVLYGCQHIKHFGASVSLQCLGESNGKYSQPRDYIQTSRESCMSAHGMEDWMDTLSCGGHCRREESPSRALILTVIYPPLTAATSPVGICGGQRCIETDFYSSTSISPFHCH